MSNWDLQITYRSIKNVLTQGLEKVKTPDFAHLALYDSKGQMIHVEGSHALHFFGFSQTIGFISKYFKLAPDEIIVTNDLSAGSPRLCDLNFVSAIYDGRELRGYAVSQISIEGLLNHPQILNSKSLEEEGFKIPPTPLALGVQSALFEFLAASGVSRETLSASFEEALGALKVIKDGFLFQEKRWGRSKFNEKLGELSEYTESLLRTSLHRFPDGEYATQSKVENQTLATRLKVRGENFSVDFLGTAKAATGSFNCNYTTTLSACFWFFLSLIEDEIPINVGVLRALTVEAPTGTLVNPPHHSPCLDGYYRTSQLIVANLLKLLENTLPQEFSQSTVRKTLALAIKSKDKFLIQTFGCGTDAGPQHDGVSVIKTGVHNQKSKAMEYLENGYDFKILQSDLRMINSLDAVHSGGRGLGRVFSVEQDCEIKILSQGNEDHSEIIVEEKPLKLGTVVKLSPGTKVILATANGENYGQKN